MTLELDVGSLSLGFHQESVDGLAEVVGIIGLLSQGLSCASYHISCCLGVQIVEVDTLVGFQVNHSILAVLGIKASLVVVAVKVVQTSTIHIHIR
jgi:hypothetical protein